MSIDLVIRGSTVVDGSGAPGFTADVAVQDGRIVQVGRVAEKGTRELDADGLLVTPGFIDGHTHMDAQVNWDPLGTSSCWHGVTSVVMGNCGFTIAPVRRGKEALVVRNLERAEDISGEAMAAGIDWTWETFPEYLDAVDKLPKGINYASQIGHSALRTFVMGERAFTEAANEEDLAAMTAELSSALNAGAIGFTTSRGVHETSDDRPVASRLAKWSEIEHLVATVGQRGAMFELALERYREQERNVEFLNRLKRLAMTTGAAVTYGIAPIGSRDFWISQLDVLSEAVAEGGRMIGQSHARGPSTLESFETQLSFDRLVGWREVRSHPLEEQKRLLRDPEIRAKLVHAAHHGDYGRAISGEPRAPDWSLLRVYQGPFPPHPLVVDAARERGMDPVDYMIELALENDFKQFFISSLVPASDETLLEIMRHPQTVMTFSDTGAHVSQIADANVHSYMLSYWARERGEFTVEEAVEKITSKVAKFWGFTDRGLIREGMMADLNLIDFANLTCGMPEVLHDLPGGATRLMTKAEGIRATVVAGQVVVENREHAGALPGRLLRRGRTN